MKVALVHDWLTGTRGGEKVLLELVRMFPGAPVFTLFHFPGSQHPEIEAAEIRTTFLQKLVTPRADYRKLLPLFFVAAETWDLSGFDLVISSSHCVAKNAKRAPGSFHLCYCHTPVRYLHEQFDDYFRNRSAAAREAARLVRAPLRAWDLSTVRRVDAFLANSENVKGRIDRLWGREAAVVFPPVDTQFYTPPPRGTRRGGFLVVSALAPYKRLDDAIDAANARGLPLAIAGFGPERSRLAKRAGETIRFLDTPNDEMLRELYRASEAVLMPGEEDFGIVPLEAQACGTPVVALGLGGATETVRDGETGVLYAEPGAGGLLAALDRLRGLALDSAALPRHAARFSRDVFRARFREALETARAGHDRSSRDARIHGSESV
ncbi:MAG TPA: glycosyltransferase [Thermoanaerobaculia bacterium]|nr:glycosyltransferase [Thermoanaerobaculia bacterium]